MRYVQIPQPIQLRDRFRGTTGDTVTFRDFALSLWLNDTRWEKPKTNLARLMKVYPQFGREPGNWIELEDQDWAILKNIIDVPAAHPSGEPVLYAPLIHLQLLDFEKAVLEAPVEDPRQHAESTNGKSENARA
jgi:hypothetical protein